MNAIFLLDKMEKNLNDLMKKYNKNVNSIFLHDN